MPIPDGGLLFRFAAPTKTYRFQLVGVAGLLSLFAAW